MTRLDFSLYDVFDKYPKLPPNKFWGDLKNVGSGQCLDTFGKHPPEKAGISGCHGYGGAQMFRLNTEGQLTSGEWCMKTDKREGITISYCDNDVGINYYFNLFQQ